MDEQQGDARSRLLTGCRCTSDGQGTSSADSYVRPYQKCVCRKDGSWIAPIIRIETVSGRKNRKKQKKGSRGQSEPRSHPIIRSTSLGLTVLDRRSATLLYVQIHEQEADCFSICCFLLLYHELFVDVCSCPIYLYALLVQARIFLTHAFLNLLEQN